MNQQTPTKEPMTSLATLDPPIMESTDVTPDAYPGHANVLALVSAYKQSTENPMPWSALVEVVEWLQLESSDVGLPVYGHTRAREVLGDIVTDLRRLDLLHFGPSGTDLTCAGEGVAVAWNGTFKARREAALTALKELRVV